MEGSKLNPLKLHTECDLLQDGVNVCACVISWCKKLVR